jgi:hypothetical protein
VAGRAREAGVDVQRVLAEAGVGQNRRQIVTFPAQGVGTRYTQIRIREQIHDGLARLRRLAELITAFQNVREFGTVRPVRPSAAELAIVVAIILKTAVRMGHRRADQGFR